MTNYFGKSRLIKIFYGYISLSPEKEKDFMECRKDNINALKEEYGRTSCYDFIFRYKRHEGSEWLECSGYKYLYKFFADGRKATIISIDEYLYNEDDSNPQEYQQIARVVSWYSKDFVPNATNKN